MKLPASFSLGPARARLAGNAMWTFAATMSAYVATALGGILAARLLGETGFGQLGIVRSTVLTFGVLAGTGLGIGATKYVAELRRSDPARAGRILGLLFNVALVAGGLAMLAVAVMAEPLAVRFLDEPELVTPLRVASLLLLLGSYGGVQVGALSGFEDFRSLARIAAIEGTLTVIGVVAGALFGGVQGAMWGTVVGVLAALPLKHFALRRQCAAAGVAIAQRGEMEYGILWSFVVPAFSIAVSVQPFEWLGRLLLAREPGGFAEVGLFTAAFAWGQFVLFLPGQVLGPSMPIIADLFANGSDRELRALLKDLVLLSALLGGLAAAAIALAAGPIMAAYGPGFTRGIDVLLLLLLAHWIAALAVFFKNLFTASGRMWLQAMHSGVWGLSLIAALVLFERSATGFALAYVVAYGVMLVLQAITAVVFMRRHTSHGAGGGAGQTVETNAVTHSLTVADA